MVDIDVKGLRKLVPREKEFPKLASVLGHHKLYTVDL